MYFYAKQEFNITKYTFLFADSDILYIFALLHLVDKHLATTDIIHLSAIWTTIRQKTMTT